MSFSCREGTGDMRAALFLTWSFDGSSSFHLVIHGPQLQTRRKFASPPVHEMHHACMAAWHALCRGPRCRLVPTRTSGGSDLYFLYYSWCASVIRTVRVRFLVCAVV